jgi:hypothetical protein
MNFSFNKIQPIDTYKIIPLVSFLHLPEKLQIDMFWNKWLSILKFLYIFVAMLSKFFYSHTYKSQVLQQFLGFIILKTIIKFIQYDLRIFAGFIHSGIMLLQSIWWNLKMWCSVRRRLRRMNMWRRMLLRSLFSWLILKRRDSVRRF